MSKQIVKTLSFICYDDDTFDVQSVEGFDAEDLIGIAFGLLKQFGVDTEEFLNDDDEPIYH